MDWILTPIIPFCQLLLCNAESEQQLTLNVKNEAMFYMITWKILYGNVASSPMRKEKKNTKKKIGKSIAYFCIINFLQSLCLKEANIYYFTVSVGQDSWYSLTVPSGSGPLKAAVQVLARAAVILRLNRERISFQVHLWVGGTIQFLVCCLIEGLRSSIAVGWRPPLVSRWTSP